NCMSGNQMDTTCSDITMDYAFHCNNQNVHNLFGVQFFDSLDFIDCNDNQITYIPPLPNHFHYLTCDDNNLTSLPFLPNNLITLYCGFNQLTSLPNLPSTL